MVIPVALILFALARPAQADRWRGFPTIGGGVVVGSEETHGHLWVGAIVDRPTARLTGHFVGAALELDFHGDVVTAGGTLRIGWMAFADRRGQLHAVSTYFLLGGAAQVINEDIAYVARVGMGVSIPPLLALLRARLAVPTTFDIVIDAGDRGVAAQFRISWGF
jgi:hypothetical protein